MKLFKREKYLSKIRGFYYANDIIKVITGIRRCGKSSLMQMIADELIENGFDDSWSFVFVQVNLSDIMLPIFRF